VRFWRRRPALGRRCHSHILWQENWPSARHRNRSQRPIKVNRDLTIPNSRYVIIGDLAYAVDEKERRCLVVAQVRSRAERTRQSHPGTAGREERAPPFHYFNKGENGRDRPCGRGGNIFASTFSGCSTCCLHPLDLHREFRAAVSGSYSGDSQYFTVQPRRAPDPGQAAI